MSFNRDINLELLYEQFLTEKKDEQKEILNKDENQIVTGKDRGEASTFCKYNPEIRKFALSSKHNMEVVFAFVFFTMQKSWYDVLEYYPPFMEWYLTRAKKTDFKYNVELFSHLPNKFGKKDEVSYLKKLHDNMDEIYEFIKEHQDDELAVFLYINENIDGLAVVKSAFAVQLILGRYGCLDSVNQRVYGSMIDLPKSMSLSFSKSGGLTAGGQNTLDRYLEALNILGKDLHSQILWDDWCDIIEKKLLYSAREKESGLIEITLPNGSKEKISPYRVTAKNEKEIEKAKDTLEDMSGKTVSRQHRDLVLPFSENVFVKWLDEILEE